jgi:hypothetical protein
MRMTSGLEIKNIHILVGTSGSKMPHGRRGKDGIKTDFEEVGWEPG